MPAGTEAQTTFAQDSGASTYEGGDSPLTCTWDAGGLTFDRDAWRTNFGNMSAYMRAYKPTVPCASPRLTGSDFCDSHACVVCRDLAAVANKRCCHCQGKESLFDEDN